MGNARSWSAKIVMYLTSYNSVQAFNLHNGEEIFGSGLVKGLKEKAMRALNAYMFEKGIATYGQKAKDILSYLIHITCVTGVQCVGRDTIVAKTGAHPSTVSRVIKRLVEDGIFTVGYLNDLRRTHYVFLFRLHDNFQKALKVLFGVELEKIENQLSTEDTHNKSTEINDATSPATSDATSSEAETPCGSKDQGPKNVSTINTKTTNSFKRNLRNIEYNSAAEQEKIGNELSLDQESIAVLIEQSEEILDPYKEKAWEIAATLPPELDEEHFMAIRNLMRNQLTTKWPKYSAVSYFQTMFQNELLEVRKTLELQNAIQEAIYASEFTFYDWVNSSPSWLNQRSINTGSEFTFYNWLKK